MVTMMGFLLLDDQRALMLVNRSDLLLLLYLLRLQHTSKTNNYCNNLGYPHRWLPRISYPSTWSLDEHNYSMLQHQF